ncbi:DUF397 domain-containing protein [Streptomyces sp. NPDC057621]|uniref:DUF397 domain-containing protein n=1 Tax=Streptomyces liliiviolaceus TaxID=2823109 RepID=A0A940XXN2_9ACTN|nr:DUF397 domain-containing protein [Streptomyces liliiviolaceus]MBQ0847044.1 DUF397 domain-containing protein [Streptomyces liliiviolaceus]
MSHTLHWQKSTFSDGGEGNTCVEIAVSPGTVHLRESDSPGAELNTTVGPLAHLILGVKAGAVRTTT